jgi:hypothetical protein
MGHVDYPIDLRADYPESSSRGWAALTILFIKFLAIIPHAFILLFLGIAQMVVAYIAQIAVAFGREYPRGMFDFVAGVLRWNTRVSAFVFSLTDRYPPFTLQPDADYPVDVAVRRPAQHSRMYALFTVLGQLVFIALSVWFLVELARGADWASSAPLGGTDSPAQYNLNSNGWSGLLLRQIAALPHLIVVAVLGIAAFVVWLIVQWVILFVARYPRGMFAFVAGVLRWQTRVGAYGLGLIDAYPPFSLDPSVGPPQAQNLPAQPPLPPAPLPPAPMPTGAGTPQQGPGSLQQAPSPDAPREAPSAPEPPAPPLPPAGR